MTKDTLDNMVRDFTQSVPLPKSEVRRRIQEYADERVREALLVCYKPATTYERVVETNNLIRSKP